MASTMNIIKKFTYTKLLCFFGCIINEKTLLKTVRDFVIQDIVRILIDLIMSEEIKETIQTQDLGLKEPLEENPLQAANVVVQSEAASQNQQYIQDAIVKPDTQIQQNEEGTAQRQGEEMPEQKPIQNLEVNLNMEGESNLHEQGSQTENANIQDSGNDANVLEANIDQSKAQEQEVLQEEQIPQGQYQYQEHLSDRMDDAYDNIDEEDSHHQQPVPLNQNQPLNIENIQQNLHKDETKTEKSYVSYQYQQIPVEEYREEDLFGGHHQNTVGQEQFNFTGVEYVGQNSFLKETTGQLIQTVSDTKAISEKNETENAVTVKKQQQVEREQIPNIIIQTENLQKKEKKPKSKKQTKVKSSQAKNENFEKKKEKQIQKIQKVQKVQKIVVVAKSKQVVLVQNSKQKQQVEQKKEVAHKAVITRQNDKARKIVPQPIAKKQQIIPTKAVEETKILIKKQQIQSPKRNAPAVNKQKIDQPKQQKNFIKQLPKTKETVAPIPQSRRSQQSLIRQIPKKQQKIAYARSLESKLNENSQQQMENKQTQQQLNQGRKTIVARQIQRPKNPPQQNDTKNNQPLIKNEVIQTTNKSFQNSQSKQKQRQQKPIATKQREIVNESVSVKKKKKKHPKTDAQSTHPKGKESEKPIIAPAQQPKVTGTNQHNNKQELLPISRGSDGKQPEDNKNQINRPENSRNSIPLVEQPVAVAAEIQPNDDHIPITSQFIIHEAEKERMRTTYQMFLDYIANYSKAIVFYKRVVENVACQIARRKHYKRNLMNILVSYFQNYAKFNRQFNESCTALQAPELPGTKNPFGNIKLQLRKGFDELVYLRRTVANDCNKISEFAINNTLQAVTKAFSSFNDKITQEEMRYFEKREIHRAREKIFYKVIRQVDKVFNQGIQGKYKKDILSEIARLVNEEQGHREILRMYGRSILPVRQAYIAAEKELFEVLQLILNQFKNESKVIYSVGRAQFSVIEDLSRNIKEQTDFKELSPLTDIDYMRYVLQVEEKKQRNIFHNRHFQHFLEMAYFDKVVGTIRNLYKGTVNKIFPLATPHEQLIHTISGNLVQFNRQMDHCLNVFIIKNLDAKIVSQGVVEFDEVLKGFIFDDTRTMRVKFRDIDRAEELICYLNEKQEDIVIQQAGMPVR